MSRSLLVRSRALMVGVLCAAAAFALPGCGRNPLSDQARSGTDAGYVAGDGSVVELPPDKREAPVTIKGTTAEGKPVDTEQWRGSVVVVNLWYAACGPCRKEAPDLAAAATKHSARGVTFLGLNTRDEAATVQAFHRTYQLPYATLVDTDGSAVAGLRGQMSPQAVPTTLVIDRKGRVSARVLGVVAAGTLNSLIEGALGEK